MRDLPTIDSLTATEAEPEKVGRVVSRPSRVERDGKNRIASADPGIGKLHSMYLSHDGRHLAMGGSGKIAVITVSTLAQGSVSKHLKAVQGGTQFVRISATGETVTAFAVGSKKVGVYTRSLSLKTEIERPTSVSCANISPDGSRIAVGSKDKKIALYSVTLNVRTLLHEWDITPYIFSFPTVIEFSNLNNGKWLAVGGDMRKMVVFNTAKRVAEPLAVIGRGGFINCLDFSPSDKWLVIGSSGDHLLTIVDTDTWTVRKEVLQAGDVEEATFSFDELAIAACSAGKLTLIGRDTFEVLAELRDEEEPLLKGMRGEWTPTGELIIKGTSRVHAYDYKTRRDNILKETRAAKSKPVKVIALSPQGRVLAYAQDAELVFLTLASKRTQVHTCPQTIRCFSFCPDGSSIAVGSGKTVTLFVNDGAGNYTQRKDQLRLLEGGYRPVTHLRWSIDGSRLAAVYGDRVVHIDPSTMTIAGDWRRGGASVFRLNQLSRTFGTQVLLDVDFYRTACGPMIRSLGAGRIEAFAASHHGSLVAAGGNGKLALVDVATLEATLVRPNRGWVMGLAFAPDDVTLAIGSHDKTVNVLHIPSGLVIYRCGERTYWPRVLCIAEDGGTIADAGSNEQLLCAYSCDGSRLPLVNPMDGAPMLRVRRPQGSETSDFSAERTEIITEMVSQAPMLGINEMPLERELQPLGRGARLLEVLASRTERAPVEAILSVAPALAVLPSSDNLHPCFDVSMRLRDVRTVRILLQAAAAAPVPLRATVATKLLPRIAELKMGSAVTAFLRRLQLEPSGAAIKYACNTNGSPLTALETLELHPTWGGEGSLIWLNYADDLKLLQERRQVRRAKQDASPGADGAGGGERVTKSDSSVDDGDLRSRVEDDGVPRTLAALWRRVETVLGRAWDLLNFNYLLELWHRVTGFAHRVWYEHLRVDYRRVYDGLGWAVSKLPPGSVRTFAEERALPLLPEPEREGSLSGGRTRVGVEVRPLRVPLPGLSSKRALEALATINLPGTFDNPCMSAVVNCLWNRHFLFNHVITSAMNVLHVTAFIWYSMAVANGQRTLIAGSISGAFADDENRPTRLAASSLAFFSLYVLVYEIRQILGLQIHTGIISGLLEYATSPWNISDLLSALLPAAAIALDLSGGEIASGHVNVKGLLAGASLALFGRTAQLLRGFKLTGWLVMVLQQNIVDMAGFIIVVFLILLFFSVSFVMLFDAQALADPDYDGEDYSHLGPALMASFFMGVFGEFEPSTFEEHMMSPVLARAMFIVFMILVGVVSLNALIAFLGDSYAKVQERQQEATLTLKALLIVGARR